MSAPDPSPSPALSGGGLLPCPFCGAFPKLIVGRNQFDDVEIECPSCNTTNGQFNCDNDHPRQEWRARNKADAIAAWNRRAPSPLLSALREAREALGALVNAKSLNGVRAIVAGWNGENLPEDKRYGRHPDKLGATLPKTNCGEVYALDEAMTAGRATLAKIDAALASAQGEKP